MPAGVGLKRIEQTVQQVSRSAEGARSVVYAHGGTWHVARGATPRHRTYRDELRHLTATKNRQMAELRDIYRKRPTMVSRKEFEDLDATHRRVLALVAGHEPVGAEGCAHARSHLVTVNDRVDEIYWRVRLVMLNESM